MRKTLSKLVAALADAGHSVGGNGAATRQEKQLVVKNCLRNRGYKVLNQGGVFHRALIPRRSINAYNSSGERRTDAGREPVP